MFRAANLPKKQLQCPHCQRSFKAPVVQPQRAGIDLLACEGCGRPVVLEMYDELLAWFLKRPAQPDAVPMELAILPCPCGGKARADAPARCPGCKKPLPGTAPSESRKNPVPLVGEPRQSPAVWDPGCPGLRAELERSAVYALDSDGSRFAESCLALPALALVDPERAFGLLRQVLEANPDRLDEESYYQNDGESTIFTLTVALLTAALNGAGRPVLAYVASHLGGAGVVRWIPFLVDAMAESDQLNRMARTTWLDGGKSRSDVEERLRAG